MDPDTPLDYALFRLSPCRSRCELVVSGRGCTETIASGLVKPFLVHLGIEDGKAPQLIRLDGVSAPWFKKGTLERFVRFVSTPEVLELVATFDSEMSQLEGARKIYAQGTVEPSSGSDEQTTSGAAAADITKRELLKAIDVRLIALRQDLATACSRTYSAGFIQDSIDELILFADHFAARRLSEACRKFKSVCQRRPDLMMHHLSRSKQWKVFDDGNVRCSSGSDMSIDEAEIDDGGGRTKESLNFSGETHPHRLGDSQHPLENTVKPPIEHRTEDDRSSAEPVLASSSDQLSTLGNSRRLSVQDRINLFENKKKDHTPGSSGTTSTENRTTTAKGEHRRVPSVEKSVLRRWSGLSDMSIDPNGNESNNLSDKKDSNIAGTPRSVNFEGKSLSSCDSDACILDDSATSDFMAEERSESASSATRVTNTGSSLFTSGSSAANTAVLSQARDIVKDKCATICDSKDALLSGKELDSNIRTSFRLESDGLTGDAALCNERSSMSCKRGEDSLDKDKLMNQNPFGDEHNRLKGSEAPNIILCGPSTAKEPSIHKDGRHEYQLQYENVNDASVKEQPSQVVKKSAVVDPKLKCQSNSRVQVGASHSDEAVSEGNKVPGLGSQSKVMPKKSEEVARKKLLEPNRPSLVSSVTKDDSEGANSLNQTSLSGKEHSTHDGRNKSLEKRHAAPSLPVNRTTEFLAALSSPIDAMVGHDMVPRSRKGNIGLTDELQMKADELEKLFLAHNMRVQNDLPSSRRSKPSDVQVDHAPKRIDDSPVINSPAQHSSKRHPKEGIADECESSMISYEIESPALRTYTPNLGEESRGKSYEKYMRRREVKLREDWNLMREKKEATMRALQNMLEQSEAEMRGKIAQSSYVQRSVNGNHSTRMSSILLDVKYEDQGAESLEEQFEQVQYDQDKYNSDNLSGDGSSRSTESRKQRSKKNLSSVPKAPVAPIPKPSVRSSNTKSSNRRITDNIVAQSVPSMSDLKKENTKPPTGIGRNSARVQAKNFARSKSITEESNRILKEGQSRRSQSMRKSSGPSDLNNIIPLNEGLYDFVDSKCVKGQSERAFTFRAEKSSGSKPLTRTYNGAAPVIGVAKFEGMFVSNVYHNGDMPIGFLDSKDEDSADDVKDECEYERTSIEEHLRESDIPADSESERPGLGLEFNSDEGCSESGDVSQTIKLNDAAGNTQAYSWSSHLPQVLPYLHDNVDGDDIVESPGRSPAPWDSLDSYVARMRKKWGSTQAAVIDCNSSPQSRKDSVKGFKKLLKFGRKSRGVDSLLNDCVSVSTTSEGDDDFEDGHPLILGSSDDIRKSRMGSVPSYDGFIENEIFSEQALCNSIPNPPPNYRAREDHLMGSSLKAPRSFFSLPPFRGKTGDAKPR